uniref:Uncharacterized protein n=1 Tax=Chelonoidis abingdonii TaxID=106734 RepID=A0A8C0FXD3_CHEAB
MIIGLIAAVANGTGLPLIIFVFAEMTNSFVMIGQAVNMFAYYYVGIGFAIVILSTIQVWTFLTSAATQTARIHQKFFFAVLHQEMAWFDTSQIGTLNTRQTDDINTIHEVIGDKICIFVQFFTTFLTGIVIGFVYGWKLTLVILSVSPLLAAAAAFLASFTTKELSAYARAGSVAEEILTSIRTVVAFNGQMKALAKYDVNLENARKVGVKKSITTYTSLGFTEFVLFGAFALAFWYGTKLTVEEKENYDNRTCVFFSALLGAFSLGQGSPHLESVANARGAAYEVYKVISKHHLIDSSAKEGYRPDKLKGEIEFKDIHFSYPSRPDVKILKGLNLKVQSGKTIALVGSSGCGKSTAIQLLQRFYDPVQGEITLDGRDIRTLNIKWLREHIGLVSQEPILFAVIPIRCCREGITDSEVEKTAKEASAFDFISRLGAQLSGGQKQQIAIARALARNPRILLLDEATSALDTQSDSIVQAAIDKARAGRTTIVIAHRLSTIRTADIIAGFHNDVVVEQGTHSQLMTQKGVYYSLVMQQDLEDLKMENLTDLGGFEEPGIIELGSIPKRSRRCKSRKTSCKKKSSEKKKTKEKEVSENVPAVPYSRILALNKPEWLHIFFGVIAAAFSGGVYPAFAVIFGKIIGPSTYNSTATGSQLGLLTKTACTLLTAIIIAFVYDWRLTLLILACIPFIIAANAVRLSFVAGHALKDQKALEEAGRISAEVVENIRTVASLSSEDAFCERHNASLNGPYRAFLSILFGAMNVGQSTSLAPDFGKAKVSAQRIFQLLDRKPFIDSYSEKGLPAPAVPRSIPSGSPVAFLTGAWRCGRGTTTRRCHPRRGQIRRPGSRSGKWLHPGRRVACRFVSR